MARDYAKRTTRRRSVSSRTSPRGNRSTRTRGGWLRPYFAGLVSGLFASFLLYLGTLRETETPEEIPSDTAAAQPAEAPKPRFDFYTLLPEQTIEVEVEPAATVSKPHTGDSTGVYLLQAGSFRQRDDADRRRAELLLLGLEPTVQETTGDNGRWFRVYLGPYDTQAAMSRARGLTANQGIDTLPLKRAQP